MMVLIRTVLKGGVQKSNFTQFFSHSMMVFIQQT